MQFTLSIAAAILAATTANAVDLRLYTTSTTCGGTFITCNGVSDNVCCFSGSGQALSSVTQAVGDIDNTVGAFVRTDSPCGKLKTKGTGSQCINDGTGQQFGLSAAKWEATNGAFFKKRSTGCVAADQLTTIDGHNFKINYDVPQAMTDAIFAWSDVGGPVPEELKEYLI